MACLGLESRNWLGPKCIEVSRIPVTANLICLLWGGWVQ
jgi:hypothetical protein